MGHYQIFLVQVKEDVHTNPSNSVEPHEKLIFKNMSFVINFQSKFS